MPEPLKERYTRAYIERVGNALRAQHIDFEAPGFVEDVLADDWTKLELKDRMRRITRVLAQHLPGEFPSALKPMVEASREFGGFEAMFFPQFVEFYGLDHFDLSMEALETMTCYSSAEFAVRPFIIKYPQRMMSRMLSWSHSANSHLRRLASEGCRPRLPWAMALPDFKRDPAPILPILENLCDDDSDYVYRSVANNLNDISKDHPQLVLEIARRWQGRGPTVDRVIKHACRTLLKQGDSDTLALFGFTPPEHVTIREFHCLPKVAIGEALEFEFTLHSPTQLGRYRLEYRLHFLKANGSLSVKTFMIGESDSRKNSRRITRRHSFRRITTRTFYPGRHRLQIMVNGRSLAEAEFALGQETHIKKRPDGSGR